MNQHFVHILLCHNGTLYVGQTNNLARRLRQHLRGTTVKHTADNSVARLIHSEGPYSLEEAVAREQQLKGWSRAKKLALANGDFVALRNLSKSRDQAGRWR